MGIQEDIKELKELIKEEKMREIEKKFRFPFGKKVGRSQKKKNYVTVLIVNENGIYDFKEYQIEDQTITHDCIPRLAAAGYVMFNKKGNPMIILPNWSIEPFSPMEHYQKSLLNGSNSVGFKLLLARMQLTKTDIKPKIGKILPWVIGIGLLGLIVYAIVSSGGGS